MFDIDLCSHCIAILAFLGFYIKGSMRKVVDYEILIASLHGR